MDLKYETKMLNDKEKTQTKSDTSYQKNKQNLDAKEKEVKNIEVCIVWNGYWNENVNN